MRRATLRVLLFILLGAIVNVAVALAIAWQYPEGRFAGKNDATTRSHTHATSPSWLIEVVEWHASIYVTRYEAYWPPADSIPHRPPPWWSAANERPVIDDPERPDMTNKSVEAAYGWPLVALEYEYHFRHLRVGFSGNLYYLESVNGGVVLSRTENLAHPNDWRPVFHVMPYHVIPLHFAINTVLYGLVLSMLWFAPVRLRRRMRLRRGRCPKCAYPIGESSVCTECGAALPGIHHGGHGERGVE